MSKHKVVNGQLLQMNKSFGQLKQKQREKITEWMYKAYKKQTAEKLADEDALQFVYDYIDEAKIWIPDYEIVNRYRAKKAHFRKRLTAENVPQHIYQMESILDNAIQKMDVLEKKIAEYESFQVEIINCDTEFRPISRCPMIKNKLSGLHYLKSANITPIHISFCRHQLF